MVDLCELCGLDDKGTMPCVVCQRIVCAYCSHAAVKKEKLGASTEIPDFFAILCSVCSPPNFGPRCRLLTPDRSPSLHGVLLPW